MPDHKKGVSKEAIKKALALIREGQKKNKESKEKTNKKLRRQATFNERKTEEQRKIRESDAAMFAAKRAYNASLYKNR